MRLTLNGEARTVPDACTVAELIAELGLAGKRVAVERNEELVPRGQHAVTRLCDGDRLEVVEAIGGG